MVPFAVRLNEFGIPQDFQVLRKRGLGQPEDGYQVINAHFPNLDRVDDQQPLLISKMRQKVCGLLNVERKVMRRRIMVGHGDDLLFDHPCKQSMTFVYVHVLSAEIPRIFGIPPRGAY